VASGGAGATAHFVDVFIQADVSAALAAGIFHAVVTRVQDVKNAMREAGLVVRP
jgi:imidazole glycerol phosphate synthase subunit HisF